MEQSRNYNSPLRTSQTEQTRHLILDTLAEMVADDGFEGIVVNDLAERAGIAARTIYRHFPDRDALHDALADRIAELIDASTTGLGDRRSDWPDLIQKVYLDFDAEETICTVGARLNAVRARSSADSARRRSMFREQIRANYPDLTDPDIAAVLAVLQIVGSSRTWLRFKEELDMTGEQSGPVMRWVLELVLADLEKRGSVPKYEIEDSHNQPSTP